MAYLGRDDTAVVAILVVGFAETIDVFDAMGDVVVAIFA
jgi:hypothetical protein